MTNPTDGIKPNVVVPSWNGMLIVNRLDRFEGPHGTIGLGNRILQTGEYCREEVETVLRLLKILRHHRGRRLVAYDLGANIGCHCIKWGSEFRSELEIVAVEAQRHIYYMLCGNIALNSLYNITALNLAVSNVAGEIEFSEPDYTKHASFASLELRQTDLSQPIGQSLTPTKNTLVEAVTLESIYSSPPDFIKLDIEGMEVPVLAAGHDYISEHRPAIFCEHIKSDKARLTEILNGLNYRHVVMGQDLIAMHTDDPAWNNVEIKS